MHTPHNNAARAAADEAVATVAASNAAWIERHALPAIRAVAYRKRSFTADDVWAELTRRACPEPPERRALGAAMRAAARAKLIAPTGLYERSNRPETHARPVMVWLPAEASRHPRR